jgi:hypothetical protein
MCGRASCFVWGWVFRSFTGIGIRACFFGYFLAEKVTAKDYRREIPQSS